MFHYILKLYTYKKEEHDGNYVLKLVLDHKKINSAIGYFVFAMTVLFTVAIVIPDILQARTAYEVLVLGMIMVVSTTALGGYILKLALSIILNSILEIDKMMVINMEEKCIEVPDEDIRIPFASIDDVTVSKQSFLATTVQMATVILKKGKKTLLPVPFQTREDGNEFIAFMRNILGKSHIKNVTLLK
jgi:hypothetical protein